MNILVVCHYGLYQEFSSSFVHAQARAYVELGHNVQVLIPTALGKNRENHRFFPLVQYQLVDGVHLHYIRFFSLSNYGKKRFNTISAQCSFKIYFHTLLKDFVPDVVHAHTLGFDSDLGAWLKKRLNCPLVVTTHGSDTSLPYMQGERDFLRECCDQADVVVGVSSKLVRQLEDCGTDTNLHSILNGFALQHLLSEEKKPNTWIQVGHLIPQKCQKITLHAFSNHLEYNSLARLTIVGEGVDRSSLETLCSEWGISHAVRFTGPLTNRDVLAEMAVSQFFVMPSHPEGFGIVYLEAMANGCITIGTEGEGIADLIVHGKNGFLVPPDNTEAIVSVIDWCIAHPEEAAAVAECGRRDALALTWEKNAKEYITLFQELINT